MPSSPGVSARTRSFQRCVAALAVCAVACAQGNPDEPDGAVTDDVVTEIDAAKLDAPDVPSPTDAPDVVDAPSTPDLPDVPSPVDVVDAPPPSDAPVDAGPSCAFAMCGDRCVDTAADPRNCGACGNDCGALPGVDPSRVACRAGACDVSSACLAGRAHCSTNPADGCEADVTTASRCGSCSTACTGDTPVCGPSTGGRYACQSGCAAPTSTRCGSTCVDTTSDIVHCGACGRACAPMTGGVPTCAASVCGVRCVTGYHSCGGLCASNTSVDTCGAACAPCPAPLNGRATCDGTACGFACNTGFHRCGSACASDASPATCGASCSPCTAPANATATCDGVACGFTCNAGFARMGSACVAIPAPRLVAPLSTAFVTSRRPTLRWALAAGTDGAQVDLCRDRACAMVLSTFTATGSSGAPSADVNAGLVYWRVRGAVGASRGTVNSPVWQFTVLARGASVDTSWGTSLDVNGDGYSDLAVGQPQVGGQPGRAFVFHGSASGAPRTASTSLTGPDGSGIHYFGYSVASAGDVNGDGYGDLIVGASDADGAGGNGGPGSAFVYLGRATGVATTPSATLRGPAGTGSGFGYSVSAAGDVNGDGYGDVVVGAIYANGNRGAAYVFHGGASGISTTPAVTLTSADGANSYFGAVSSAGDVNGDGYGDVFVGATAANRGYVFHGGASGISTTPATTLTSPDAAAAFGVAFAADFDADGYTDLAVGGRAAMSGTGRVYVYRGSSAGIATTPSASITGPDAGGNFGAAVGSPGDVDGDGFIDLAVGANLAGSNAGRVYVFRGGATGVSTTALSTLSTTDAGGRVGWSVGGLLDVNRDGYADVVSGAPYVGTSVGRAYLFHGSATGPRVTTTTITPTDGSNSYFGWSVGR